MIWLPVEDRPVRTLIALLRNGQTFCVSCGRVANGSGRAMQIVRCAECHIRMAQARFCRFCGSAIEQERIARGKKTGFEARQCEACVTGKRKPHPRFGVQCPAHWNDLEKPPTSEPAGTPKLD